MKIAFMKKDGESTSKSINVCSGGMAAGIAPRQGPNLFQPRRRDSCHRHLKINF
ncbi:MAG: hypothetical protein ACLQSR_11185 [Limisphaerales bacterium]